MVSHKTYIGKAVAACLAVCITAASFSLPSASAEIKQLPRPEIPGLFVSPDDPLQNLTARSAVVMDAATGRIIYQRDMDARRFPASTTKMMTLIVALENADPDDIVTVSKTAAGTEGSTLWLEPGDKIRLGDLLEGMMMVSGNDATVAIAEHIAGSVDAFAAMMTEKAHDIGATDTSFVNSSGLPDENHYTTAHDLALIAAYGYSVPGFKETVSIKEKNFQWVRDPEHRLRNENQMLWLYRGGNGVKTGYTDAAGRCLVSGAERDGIQLVAVVLDSVYMWNDSIALLDYGFDQVEPNCLANKGEIVAEVPVVSGRKDSVKVRIADSLVLPDVKGDTMGYEREINLPHFIKAPVKEGDVVGRLVIKHDGEEVASADLVAAESIEQKSFFLAIKKAFNRLLNGFWR